MESKFLTTLDIEEINDNNWKLIASFIYHSDLLGKDIIISKGFITDFASVPRIPFAYWLCGDTAHEPAVVHDWLYQTHLVAKDIADKIFLEAMTIVGIPAWRRNIMYYAVKLFGKSAYDSGPFRLEVINY